jgi:hypothetical protein
MTTECITCPSAQRAAATTDARSTCTQCGTAWEPEFPAIAANDGATASGERDECRGCVDARDALERLCDLEANPWVLCDECLCVVSPYERRSGPTRFVR